MPRRLNRNSLRAVAPLVLLAGVLPWLSGAIACGGAIGPGLLMLGLAGGSASQASLLLNLEGVLTALLAWLVFREHVDARIATGMGLIALGAVVLAWRPGDGFTLDPSALLVAAACLAWAVDNNLTRRVSGGDAALIHERLYDSLPTGTYEVRVMLLRSADERIRRRDSVQVIGTPSS